MRISKKVLGAAMGIVMLVTQAMPALAASTTAPTTTGGTANILDYKVETVVVPTTLKITLNPNGYVITTKYEKAATYEADTVYYTESSGAYTKAATQPTSSNFTTGGPYYKAVTSNAQIVSLSYGIVNKSTGDKNVKVDFAATYTAAEGKKAIKFVDSAAKAQAYNASSNADGAKKGEHKIYLAVVSASALPTANTFTYAKTTDTTIDNTKTYYTKSASGFTKVTSAEVADIATYYEATPATAIGIGITAAELSDVTMTTATAGIQAFAEGTTNKADASIAYKLGKATYALKEGEKIDFSTTQADLANKLEMSAIGGVAGFTLTGAVNADADWTTADTTAILITPTYTITDATGSETAVENTYNQVKLGPNLSQTSYTKDADNSAIEVTVNNLGDDTIKSVVEGSRALDSSFVTISGNKVTMTTNLLQYITGTSTFKIVTNAGKELTFTVSSPQS